MKKISVLLLAVLMVFAFVSCDDSTDAPVDVPSEKEYADSVYAKALIDSINKQAVYENIMAAVNPENEDNSLVINYVPENFDPSKVSEEGEEVSIKVTATVKDYTKGFHEAPTGIDGLKLTSGTAEITVTGTFKKIDNTYSFELKSYTGKTTETVNITDNEGKHTFEVKSLSGTATGTISLTNNQFSVADIALQVPAVKDVDVYLDEKPVDYEKLCKDTGFNPGDDITVDLN